MAIAAMIKAGIEKVAGKKMAKEGMKEYQEGIAKRAAKTRAEQMKELNAKLAKTKDKAERSKLRLQIEGLKKRQATYDFKDAGLGGKKKMATKKKEAKKDGPLTTSTIKREKFGEAKKSKQSSGEKRKPDTEEALTTDAITRKKYEVGSKTFDFVKKGLAKKKGVQATKASKKKIKKKQKERRKASEPTAQDLLDQLGESSMIKQQAE